MNAETIDTIKKYVGLALAGAGAVIEVVWPGHAALAVALAMVGGLVAGMGMDNARGKTARQVLHEVIKHNSAEPAKRASKPPPVPPIAKIGIVVCVLLLGGCAWFNENAKPVLRTIVEVARHLCLLTAEEQDAAARDGLTPAQFCAAEENLRPFIDEVLAAKQRASGKAGLTSGGEQ